MAITRTTDWAKDVRSVLVVLERSKGQLRQAEQLVADYVLDKPGTVVKASISEVAALAGTSDATVLRCCRRLGYDGFPEFKLALARDLAHADQTSDAKTVPGVDDPPERIALVVYENSIEALKETMELQQVTQLRKVVAMVAGAERLLIVAAPSRSSLASEAERRFGKLGLLATLVTSHTASETLAGCRPGYVVVVFSDAEDPSWWVTALRFAKSRGAGVVVFTPEIATTLDGVDAVLHAGYRPFRAGDLVLESLVPELFLLETVVAACTLARYEESVAALTDQAVFRDVMSSG